MKLRLICLCFLFYLFRVTSSHKKGSLRRCINVKCPNIANCRRSYIPRGSCCRRCRCQKRSFRKKHGYFWDNQLKACRVCRCNRWKQEVCWNNKCPDQQQLESCKRPIFNFYCGCRIGCRDAVSTTSPPTTLSTPSSYSTAASSTPTRSSTSRPPRETRPAQTTISVTLKPGGSTCDKIECPQISNCNKKMLPVGRCCQKCACSDQEQGEVHGYFWKDHREACRKCKCHRIFGEVCEEGNCPNQQAFRNCKQPIFDFHCGCIIACKNTPETTTTRRPTFPPFPSFP